jgi:hypothetical protein
VSTTPTSAERAVAAPDGQAPRSPASDASPAAVRGDGRTPARTPRAHRERLGVANAVKAIAEQNRQHAAIVEKTQRVVP